MLCIGSNQANQRGIGPRGAREVAGRLQPGRSRRKGANNFPFLSGNSLNPSHMPCMHLMELSYLFCFIRVASTDTWERIMETECDIMQFFWMSCYVIVWSVCWLMISFINFMVYPSVAVEALP